MNSFCKSVGIKLKRGNQYTKLLLYYNKEIEDYDMLVDLVAKIHTS